MRKAVLATVLFAIAASIAIAQSDRGTITGTVSDPAGAVIANAPLQARNVETGSLYEGASSSTGNYTLVGGAGADTLEAAGTGAHIFTGGAGADTFTYRVGGDQMRIVTDFQDGVDHIHLWDNHYYGNVPLESLTIADSAAGAVISWHGASQMVLTGIAASQLTHDDFVV